MPDPREREHYRIAYPIAERPQLLLGDDAYEVLDCSERGLRCGVGRGVNPTVGDEIRGVVRFRRGAEVHVAGVITRVEAGGVSVRLAGGGIPLRVMLEEQRYLRTRYPMLGR